MKTAPKTVIIGGAGLIGRELLALYRSRDPETIGTSRTPQAGLKYLDLLSCDIAPLKLRESGYQDAIIAAGIAKIFVCERDKAFSNAMTDGTLNLVRQLVREGIKPVYISSDCVFDGRVGHYDDDAPTHPLNEYGKQKDAIEKGIRELSNGKYLIARFSKVFTLNKGDGTIFDEMASKLMAGQTIRMAYDQVLSPTLLSDSAQALRILQANNVNGTVNISSPEIWTRYDLAVKMAGYLGIDPQRVERVSLEALQEVLVRPKDATFNTQKLIRETQYQFKPINECMQIIAKKWIAQHAPHLN